MNKTELIEIIEALAIYADRYYDMRYNYSNSTSTEYYVRIREEQYQAYTKANKAIEFINESM